jgi:TonB family protein
MVRTITYSIGLLALSLLLAAQAGSRQGVAPSAPKTATASSAAVVPAYPATAKGLKKLLDAALKTAKDGDQSALAVLVNGMEMPGYDGWYTGAFGAERAKAWTDFRRANVARSEKVFEDLLQQAAKANGEIVTQEVSDTSRLMGIEGVNYDCMKTPLDVYLASWIPSDPSRYRGGDLTEYFVFFDGGFRWDDSIVVANSRCLEGPGPQSVTVGHPARNAPATASTGTGTNAPTEPGVGGVGYPRCIYCPQPPFSPEGRNAKIQGTVLLSLVVQPGGYASDIKLAKGLGLGMDQNAIEAVENWRFQPATEPNGTPVAVTTEVEVTFRLL